MNYLDRIFPRSAGLRAGIFLASLALLAAAMLPSCSALTPTPAPSPAASPGASPTPTPAPPLAALSLTSLSLACSTSYPSTDFGAWVRQTAACQGKVVIGQTCLNAGSNNPLALQLVPIINKVATTITNTPEADALLNSVGTLAVDQAIAALDQWCSAQGFPLTAPPATPAAKTG